LSAEHAKLDLCHVKPGAVLGRVVDLQLLGKPPGLLRLESFVEGGRRGCGY
jgi:hypothetical protein